MTAEPETSKELLEEISSLKARVAELEAARVEGTDAPIREELRKSEARHRAVVEDQSELLLRYLPDGTRTFVNPAYCRYYGGTPEEFIGTGFFSSMTDEDRSWIKAELAGLTPQRPVNTTLRPFGPADGPGVWIEWTTRAFFDQDGRAVEFQSLGRDVSEEKQVQERLRLTQFTVDHSHDAIFWAGADGQILYANAAACDSLGYTWDELMAMGIMDMNPEQGVEAWLEQVEALRESGFSRFDSKHRTKDGMVFPVEISSMLLEFEGAEYVVGVARDLSDQRKLEAQLRQSQKMEAIGQFTGGLAHEFNNLMSVILLQAEILSQALDTPNPLLRSAVEGIEEAAERAAGTTRKLLGFSSQATLEMVPADLGEMARGVASSLERVLPENIELRVRAQENLPAVLSDTAAVEQILLNLVNNGRDAMPHGGLLEIIVETQAFDEASCEGNSWARPGLFIRITVADSGQGMSEGVRIRAFEPFFTTKPVGEGTGLGLAMVYGLARQHGGMAEAESQPGEGTRIHIYFPAYSGVVENPSSSELRDRPGRGEETILLVEDEEMLREVACAVLEQHGYRVLVAEDGKEALETLGRRQEQVDLVISDAVMPHMGGVELFHTLRKSGDSVLFLLASGYPGRQNAAGAELVPGVPFIKKPWRMGELLRKIREVLDQPPE